MPSARTQVLLGAALVAITLAAYFPAMNAGFIWDDNVYLTGNREVTEPGQFHRIWWRTRNEQYYPATVTSFWLEYRFWGAVEWVAGRLPAWLRQITGLDRLGAHRPAGYHLTNILLHAAGAVLLWRLLRRLGAPAAWLAAAVFAVHPVNVASVAWITERKNTLSLVFSAVAVLAFLRYLRLAEQRADQGLPADPQARGCPAGPSSGNPKSEIRNPKSPVPASVSSARPAPRIGLFAPLAFPLPGQLWQRIPLSAKFYALAVAAFLLALWSKTAAMPLPAVLLLCLWWLRGRLRARDLLTVAPFFAVALATTLVTMMFEWSRSMSGKLGQVPPFPVRLPGAGWAIWFYLWKTVLPIDLCMVYAQWAVKPFNGLHYWPLVLGLLAGAALWRRRRGAFRPLAFGLGLFAVLLLPALGLFPIAFLRFATVADHWQYLALAATVGLAAAGAGALFRRSRRLAVGIAAAVVGILFVTTFRQAGLYKDGPTLWNDTLAKNPACWVAYTSIASYLANEGKESQALAALDKALSLNPEYNLAWYNRGYCHKRLGLHEQAIVDFSKALECEWRDPSSHNLRGLAYMAIGDFEQAVADFSRAIDLDPGCPKYYHDRGNALARAGQYDAALDDYARVLNMGFDVAEVRNDRGVAYNDLERYDLAIADLSRAIALNSDYAEAYANRASSYLGARMFAPALADCDKAIQINPKFALAHNNRGLVFQGQGRFRQAVAEFTKAIELDPNLAKAHNNRAVAHYKLKDFDKAWEDVAACRKLKLEPHPQFIADLTRDSGRTE